MKRVNPTIMDTELLLSHPMLVKLFKILQNCSGGLLDCIFGKQNLISKKIDDITADYVIVRGGGLHTEYLYHNTSLVSASRRFLIVDTDSEKSGMRWRGVRIVPNSGKYSMNWKNTVVVISSYAHQSNILQELLDQGVPRSSIVSLYDEVHPY